MAKYNVTFVFHATVEAEDEEEAVDKGFKVLDDMLHEPQLAPEDIFEARVEKRER